MRKSLVSFPIACRLRDTKVEKHFNSMVTFFEFYFFKTLFLVFYFVLGLFFLQKYVLK